MRFTTLSFFTNPACRVDYRGRFGFATGQRALGDSKGFPRSSDHSDAGTLPDCNLNAIPDSCDLADGTSADCNANAIPDGCDIAAGTELDCNGNANPDSCDISTETSVDCDANQVPDDCEIIANDCNGNGLLDVCDISTGVSGDCQLNSFPDECDIVDGTSVDLNGNGVPDNCDCIYPQPASPDPAVSALNNGTRGRHVSFLGGTPGESEAIRVQFDVDGVPRTMFVGQPFEISESSGNSGSTPEPTSWAAKVQCDPFFTDWSVYPSVHAYGESVVPSMIYKVSIVGNGCQTNEAAYSEVLTVETSAWGDLVGEYVPDVEDCTVSGSGYRDCWEAPDGNSDFDDISAVVDKFKNLPGAIMKARADLVPEIPDSMVDFGDVPAVVDGFRGLPYPYTPPVEPCP